MKQLICRCDSGKPFEQCCKPFLNGDAKPKTAKQLMRSRFSAYARGGCGNYLLGTWHPLNRQGLNAGELSLRQVNWQDLEIIDSDQQGDKGVVEFKATYVDNEGETFVHHEISTFLREKGFWYYVGELQKHSS